MKSPLGLCAAVLLVLAASAARTSAQQAAPRTAGGCPLDPVKFHECALPKTKTFNPPRTPDGRPDMHPNGSANLIQQNALSGRGGLGNIVGNPLETTVFLSRLIFDGTFDKFPNLKVCGAHGGGYLPSYLGRTEVACQRQGQNCIIKKKPSDYMAQA